VLNVNPDRLCTRNIGFGAEVGLTRQTLIIRGAALAGAAFLRKVFARFGVTSWMTYRLVTLCHAHARAGPRHTSR
jgi:hypothetical protein